MHFKFKILIKHKNKHFVLIFFPPFVFHSHVLITERWTLKLTVKPEAHHAVNIYNGKHSSRSTILDFHQP